MNLPARRIGLNLTLCAVIFATCQFAYSQSTSSSDAESTRTRFLKIIDRPRVPLDPQLRATGASQGLIATHFTFATEAFERVPGIIIRSEKAASRRPAVILLHGTGDSKEGMLDLAGELATLGFLAVAIDGRFHGERINGG